MQQQQQHHPDDDSDDEDLSGINFPIIDNSTTNNHQLTTKISCKDDIKKSNGYDTSNNQITNNNKGVDEDAIIRCFNISVNSHINNSDTVEVFEPMPPKKEVVPKTTLSNADQPNKKQKVEQ